MDNDQKCIESNTKTKRYNVEKTKKMIGSPR